MIDRSRDEACWRGAKPLPSERQEQWKMRPIGGEPEMQPISTDHKLKFVVKTLRPATH